MIRKDQYQQLEEFLPLNAVTYCRDLWHRYRFVLKIVNPRVTKLGDYRYSPTLEQHTITLNNNLNEYSFLITYIHEVAHLTTNIKYTRKVQPHGKEWKKEFKALMHPILHGLVFPPDILQALGNYLKNPAASSCSDPRLMKLLGQYDAKQSNVTTIKDLKPGTVFLINKRTFIKGQLKRTRVVCEEIPSGRKYLIHQLAQVKIEGTSSN